MSELYTDPDLELSIEQEIALLRIQIDMYTNENNSLRSLMQYHRQRADSYASYIKRLEDVIKSVKKPKATATTLTKEHTS